MDFSLRLEQPEEYRAVEELTREAFWGQFGPDCDEHLLVHKLRKAPAFIPDLSYVAQTSQGELIGHIVFSKAKVVGQDGTTHEVLTFGPLSVLPAYWGKGIGRMLMEHTFAKAKQLDYRAIIIIGHADYYPRFGFVPAREYGIENKAGMDADAFMALPLYEGALEGISGTFIEDPVYEMNTQEKEEFDKQFPYKEKRGMPLVKDALKGQLSSTALVSLQEKGVKTLADIKRFSEREIQLLDGLDDGSLAT